MSAELSFGASLRVAWKRHRGRILTAALASATLGLAPFYPHAHIWKQLVNLANGGTRGPVDLFDLVLHGAPWVALLVFSSHMFVSAALATSRRNVL